LILIFLKKIKIKLEKIIKTRFRNCLLYSM
jgi:hypothetical protein